MFVVTVVEWLCVMAFCEIVYDAQENATALLWGARPALSNAKTGLESQASSQLSGAALLFLRIF